MGCSGHLDRERLFSFLFKVVCNIGSRCLVAQSLMVPFMIVFVVEYLTSLAEEMLV